MVAGHFGLAAGVKAREPAVPLWALMLATQWLDVIFVPLFMAKIETIEVIGGGKPGYGNGIIHANYTHSLVGALVLALVFALPAGLLRPAEHRAQIVPLMAVCAVAAIVIAALGLRQLATETRLHTSTSLAARADRLIPPGSCVLSNDPSLTVSADRFAPASPVCPAMVDAYGTLLAMTDGRKMLATPQEVHSVTALWSAEFARAPYAWLETGSQGQIPWTPALYAYFTSHFRLLGLVNGPGAHDVPEGGLYARR